MNISALFLQVLEVQPHPESNAMVHWRKEEGDLFNRGTNNRAYEALFQV